MSSSALFRRRAIRTPAAVRALACLALIAAACSDSDNDPGVGFTLVSSVRSTLAANNVEPLTAPTYRSELTDLGQALFFDKLLSGTRDVSCATCHFPDLASADARCLPGGVGGTGLGTARTNGAIVPRNSPMVLNAHLSDDLFWDGRVDMQTDGTIETPLGGAFSPAITAAFEPGLESLATQAIMPPTSRVEMRGEVGTSELGDIADGDVPAIWSAIVARIVAIPEYVDMFAAAYPTTAPTDWNIGHVGNAIAAFEAVAFARFDSPLQRFLLGDNLALTNTELQGAQLFYGAAGCNSCHGGSSFSDGRYHNIGLIQWGPGKGDAGSDDFGRERVSGNPSDRYRFRTPSLLNIELTAPYGHVGQFATLEGIVQHYQDPGTSLMDFDVPGNADDPRLIDSFLENRQDVLDRLDPVLTGTTPFDAQKIVAFLRTLTADSALDMRDLTPASVPSGLPVDVFE